MWFVGYYYLISKKNVISESKVVKTSYRTLREVHSRWASLSSPMKGRICFMISKAPFHSEIPFCCFLSGS